MTAIGPNATYSNMTREWLMAEVKRLRQLSVNNAHSWDDIVRERNELRAEIERLKADGEVKS